MLYILYTLIVTHITTASVTIFLHRTQAHHALTLHPIASHFFRVWLWLTTGMITKEWVAVHRKHHFYVDINNDPHSPIVYGIKKVLWQGTELYRNELKNKKTIQKYGKGTPNDWIERNIYSKFSWQGTGLLLIMNLILFGPIGITIWAIQMVWIPFLAAGVINGIGHYWGYRNFITPDNSKNIIPFGIIICGEELHNNHHAFRHSANMAKKWYELDIGYTYIKILEGLKLAKINNG